MFTHSVFPKPLNEPKASFIGNEFRKEKGPIILVNICSIDNYKQSGLAMMQFVNLVNSDPRIKMVYFIDTSHLHRHYDPQLGNSNNQVSTKWQENNQQGFNKLTVKYEVLSWKILTGGLYKNEFEKLLSEVKLAFAGDEKGEYADDEFRSKVLALAAEHTHLCKKKAAIDFLLEECAGACLLQNFLKNLVANEHDAIRTYITYPGPFNDAIQYNFNKRNITLPLVMYRINEKALNLQSQKIINKSIDGNNNLKVKDNSVFLIFQFIPLLTAELQSIDNFGSDIKLQEAFIHKYTQLCAEFKSSIITQEHGGEINYNNTFDNKTNQQNEDVKDINNTAHENL